MDKQDIIQMAQECHLIGMRQHLDGIYEESLERFAALVAAAEREAILQMSRDQWFKTQADFEEAIRARRKE